MMTPHYTSCSRRRQAFKKLRPRKLERNNQPCSIPFAQGRNVTSAFRTGSVQTEAEIQAQVAESSACHSPHPPLSLFKKCLEPQHQYNASTEYLGQAIQDVARVNFPYNRTEPFPQLPWTCCEIEFYGVELQLGKPMRSAVVRGRGGSRKNLNHHRFQLTLKSPM